MTTTSESTQARRFLTTAEFGELLRFKERTVRDWIAKGKIAVVRIGSNVRIPASELERLIREGKETA